MEFTMIKQILTSTLAVATISFATVTNANQAVEINETHPEPGTVEYTGPKYDFSKENDSFRVGFLPAESAADELGRNACLSHYLQQALNVPAPMFYFSEYSGVMEAALSGSMDYVWYGSSSFAGVYLENPDAMEPIITRMQPSGDLGYYSIMISRADSGINNLQDTAGKRMGFPSPNSTSGYLIPSIELPVALNKEMKDHFSTIEFAGDHQLALQGVLKGDYDIAHVWVSGVGEWSEGYTSGALRKAVDKGSLNMDDIQQIWSSKLIPNGPIAVRKAISQEAKDTVLGMQTWIHENDPRCDYNVANGQVRDWVPVDIDFYDSIIKARKAKLEKN